LEAFRSGSVEELYFPEARLVDSSSKVGGGGGPKAPNIPRESPVRRSFLHTFELPHLPPFTRRKEHRFDSDDRGVIADRLS